MSSSSKTHGRKRRSHAFDDRGIMKHSFWQFLVAGQTARSVRRTSDSVQLRIWHSPPFCTNARRVTVFLTTSSVSQRIHQRTTMRFWIGWNEISSYHPTLIGKEIGTIFSALQPSPTWFLHSTSIVRYVLRRLRVLSRAPGWTASQTTETAL